MRKIGILAAICIIWLLTGVHRADRSVAQSSAESFRAGVVLVGLRSNTSGAPLMQPLIERQLQVEQTLSPLPIVSVHVPVGQEAATAQDLRRTGQVTFAELDYAAHATDVITPTDPGWSDQWGPQQINAPTAWSSVTNTAGTIIAVVDSGLKIDHPDLAANVWTNAADIPGNLIDDDGNGKIDDVHGWHFFQRWTGSTYVPDENSDVQDDFGHGTHVAGIAAAVTNNGLGIAGIAWNAHVMPVKVLDEFGNGWYSDIAAGIAYAADNGARIINLSLGGSEASQTLRNAVDYAQNRGALIIAATGNTGGAVLYPAAYDSVLAVAATDATDHVASFSNYGPQVDVAAPGVNIYSTWPWVTGYFTKSGTSMAAPHVSGVAALVWARWPALSAQAVALKIESTAVDINEVGWDQRTGHGRVDADRAVTPPPYFSLFLPLLRN